MQIRMVDPVQSLAAFLPGLHALRECGLYIDGCFGELAVAARAGRRINSGTGIAHQNGRNFEMM
jgi:hypothetical protein